LMRTCLSAEDILSCCVSVFLSGVAVSYSDSCDWGHSPSRLARTNPFSKCLERGSVSGVRTYETLLSYGKHSETLGSFLGIGGSSKTDSLDPGQKDGALLLVHWNHDRFQQIPV